MPLNLEKTEEVNTFDRTDGWQTRRGNLAEHRNPARKRDSGSAFYLLLVQQLQLVTVHTVNRPSRVTFRLPSPKRLVSQFCHLGCLLTGAAPR